MTKGVAEQVAEALSPYLGDFNARVAVKTFAKKSLGLDPESLTSQHLAPLLDALRPALNTLVGRESTAALLDQILRRGVS